MRKSDLKGKNSRLFSGALILAVANIAVKLIGLVYKIPLTNMLGDEGMGYFNTAYQIYSWLYMLSTAGLPVAMSLAVSECNAKGNYEEKKRLLRLTFSLFSVLGLCGSALMAVLCRQLAAFISADPAYLCILCISPALFFVCISSTLRGYFQGHADMLPTAVSEIAEAIGKLVVGILLGSYALSRGFPIYKVAAYSILGISSGVAAGALLLLLAKLLGRENRGFQAVVIAQNDGIHAKKINKRLLYGLLGVAIPIMLSSSLLGMSSMLDTLIVIRRLRATHITSEAAVSLYGNYTAYCVTLFNLPPVLIYPIVNAMIPAISAARARREEETASLTAISALKLGAIIALPCALGLAALGEPILMLIFNNSAGAEMAAPLLAMLAPSIFPIAIMAVANGILQAYGMQKYTLISMLFGVSAKAIGAYFLPMLVVGGEPLRMLAAPISTFLFYLTAAMADIYFLEKHTPLRISVCELCFRPFIATVICVGFAVFGYGSTVGFLGSKLAVLIAISVAVVIYFALLGIFRIFNADELEMFSPAVKMNGFLKRIRFTK